MARKMGKRREVSHMVREEESFMHCHRNREFWDLRDAPLHLYGPEEWKTYDPAMAVWLAHADQDIREYAIERLSTATLHWDYQHSDRAAQKNQQSPARIDRLLEEIEKAHHQWPDVIPEFLRNLRFHGDDEHVAPYLLRWIGKIASQSQLSVDQGLILGTQLLLRRREPVIGDQMLDWISLLDAPSPYLRGCAAYLLGVCSDDEDDEDEEGAATQPDAVQWPTKRALMVLIGEKEIQRPGVAGPFWSPSHQEYPATDADFIYAALWMMDLLERRQDQPPILGEMPYNDITFYLHELCCDDPVAMQRMIDGGFIELALMTATEIQGKVNGVTTILEKLATDPDARIAAAARNHLQRHYEV
jgi:hypothetical protein